MWVWGLPELDGGHHLEIDRGTRIVHDPIELFLVFDEDYNALAVLPAQGVFIRRVRGKRSWLQVADLTVLQL